MLKTTAAPLTQPVSINSELDFFPAVARALRLRCPACGRGGTANGLLSTRETCSECDSDFAVEDGFFLGAIYFNYGITVLIALSVAIPLIFVARLPIVPVVAGTSAFCVGFPIWFFRYARSLWLALDYFYDQRRKQNAERMLAEDRVPRDVGAAELQCICPLCHHRFKAHAADAHTWSKCPGCFGDVLLSPAPPEVVRRPWKRRAGGNTIELPS